MTERIPAGRLAEIPELANLAAYLVSDYSSWMTGEVTFFVISIHNSDHEQAHGRVTSFNSLYGKALPERSTFFRLQVYERVGVSLVEVYERVGILLFEVYERVGILLFKVYERVGVSLVEVYERVGKSVILVYKKAQNG